MILPMVHSFWVPVAGAALQTRKGNVQQALLVQQSPPFSVVLDPVAKKSSIATFLDNSSNKILANDPTEGPLLYGQSNFDS
jgi:hypothetical protein